MRILGMSAQRGRTHSQKPILLVVDSRGRATGCRCDSQVDALVVLDQDFHARTVAIGQHQRDGDNCEKGEQNQGAAAK